MHDFSSGLQAELLLQLSRRPSVRVTGDLRHPLHDELGDHLPFEHDGPSPGVDQVDFRNTVAAKAVRQSDRERIAPDIAIDLSAHESHELGLECRIHEHCRRVANHLDEVNRRHERLVERCRQLHQLSRRNSRELRGRCHGQGHGDERERAQTHLLLDDDGDEPPFYDDGPRRTDDVDLGGSEGPKPISERDRESVAADSRGSLISEECPKLWLLSRLDQQDR
jgi:hypothetical protein